ncbi:MAG TPA: uracil-DNA glycosylase [Candidatus Saccharimonadales bacterium]|nr:uracil-DNA glycosylase [Candidatus Saccharimonadales bacterium]
MFVRRTLSEKQSQEGNPDASMVFVGEAPGKLEAQTGKPFVGRSGQFLRKTMQEVGIKESEVFITSVVKFLPQKGTPTPAQIKHAKQYSRQQIDIIDPKVVVLLGRVSCEGVLDEKISVAKEHGSFIKKDGRTYFVSFHPAAAIRFQNIREMFAQDFKKMVAKREELGI